MKKFIILTVIFITAGLCAQNLIKNGGFQEKNPDGSIKNWTVYPKVLKGGVEVSIDTTNSRSGGQSVRIYNPRDIYYTRVDQLRIPCKPHTKYIVKAYAKCQDINSSRKGGARIFVGPAKLEYPIVQFGPQFLQWQKKLQYPYSFNWTKFESTVFNSGKYSELSITLYLRNASGTIWFDDIELVEYTPDIEKNRKAEIARTLINNNINTVEKLAPALKKDLDALRKKTFSYMPEKRDPKLGMPFFAIDRELGVLFSSYLQKKFPQQKIVVSAVDDPLKSVSAFTLPAKAPDKIVVKGLKNEVEIFALNLVNVSAKEEKINLNLPQNMEIIPRLAVHIETDRKTAVDDALVRIKPDKDGKLAVSIPAGMTRQLYFNVKLRKSCSGVLAIGDKKITVECQVADAEFPSDLPLVLFGYAYPDRYRFMKDIDKTRKFRNEMHNNLAHPYQFSAPLPVFDKDNKFCPEKMDWKKMDLQLSMTKAPQHVLIVLAVHSPVHTKLSIGTDRGKPIALHSPEWNRRITLWLQAMVKGFAERGIGYDRFGVILLDEPSEEKMPYLKKLSAVVRKADPKIRIYNNFNSNIPSKRVSEFISMFDIISPHITEMTPHNMAILKKSGKEIWAYHVQNRSYPPEQMRDLFYKLRKENIKGFSYWCFYDNNPDWTPAGEQCYSVVYSGDTDEWIPSKRSEAIREGMEIYTMLTLLKEKNTAVYSDICKKIGKISHAELHEIVFNNMKNN